MRLWLDRPASRGSFPSPFSGAQRFALLAAFALLTALRLPRAWVHGRFLDEEATVFLAYAWHHPWPDALFRAFAGYWNLAANGITLLIATLVKAGALPLERAPYVTMTAALAVQCLPALLILTGRADWLRRRSAVIAALLMIVLAPASEEVFLNVLHIQFHLALCAALILALDPPETRSGRTGYGALLFLAPLCGPGAIVILPLFALRAMLDRDRARVAQLAPFAGGAAVQLLFFYHQSPMRGHSVDPATTAAAMFVRLIALPLLNYGVADGIGRMIIAAQRDGSAGWWFASTAAVAGLGALLITAARRRDGAVWLLAAGLGLAIVSFGFGMVLLDRASLFRVGSGERYNFLPLVLIGLGLIALAVRDGSAGRVWASLCLLVILTGLIRYPRPLDDYADGPSWPVQVAVWRQDPTYPLAVWPHPWTADLSGLRRACTRPGPDPTLSTDPRYCESGWAAGFYRPL